VAHCHLVSHQLAGAAAGDGVVQLPGADALRPFGEEALMMLRIEAGLLLLAVEVAVRSAGFRRVFQQNQYSGSTPNPVNTNNKSLAPNFCNHFCTAVQTVEKVPANPAP